ncbi:hypothetical protein BDN70DRAFT_936647 [Pholiota conissans]|uniref:Uncharacterized protein n=1 Tax=Pholiota conissans TaxID=109636 RepID=A0A9P5YSQ1_9AGAR|nr:hypothetical protein BDN70DRAFT_936647 [Pholiota conissans]
MSDANSTSLHQAILQAGFTDNDERVIIASALNVSMFQALLMGIYTVICGGTMYAYLTRQPSKRYLVPGTVCLLYLSNLVAFGIQWNSTKSQFVDDGATRDTIFLSLLDTQVAMFVAVTFMNAISLVLSDVLLIWRCFNLWNRSVRIISIPVFLTVAEGVSGAIGSAVNPPSALDEQVILGKVLASGIMISACTTVITTLLITYRINSFLKNKDISSRKFRNVIDIVVQSGLVSSLSLLVLGISNVITSSSPINNTQTLIVGFWTSAFVFPLAGIATTIVVARVATLSDNDDPAMSVHLTGIRFQPGSTTQSGTASGVIAIRDDSARDPTKEISQLQASDSDEKGFISPV